MKIAENGKNQKFTKKISKFDGTRKYFTKFYKSGVKHEGLNTEFKSLQKSSKK